MEAEDMFCEIEKLFLIAIGLDHLLEANYSHLIGPPGPARKHTLSTLVSGVIALREGLEALAMAEVADGQEAGA